MPPSVTIAARNGTVNVLGVVSGLPRSSELSAFGERYGCIPIL